MPFQLVPFQLVLKQVGSNKLERHLFEQIVFRLEPNESTFCPLNGSRPDESIRSALDYGDLSETFAWAFGQSSAAPTIWAKCLALTTQKFNKGRTKPNLSPNGDRSGYKFRSVQGRGQAFFGETSWNGTSWNGTNRDPPRWKVRTYLPEWRAGGDQVECIGYVSQRAVPPGALAFLCSLRHVN